MERIVGSVDRASEKTGRALHIFFIHGMWMGPWVWANYTQLADLEGFEKVTAMSLSRRRHDESASIADYHQQCLQLAIRECRHPVVLVGHSMGGLVAQCIAVSNSVAGLVLVASAPPAGIPSLRPAVLARLWRWRYLSAIAHRREFLIRREDADALLFNRMERRARAEAFAQFVLESGRAARDIMLGVPLDATRVRCPVLVIGAREDRITPPDMQRSIAERYRADYMEFPGYGHMLILEKGWERVARHIFSWIAATC